MWDAGDGMQAVGCGLSDEDALSEHGVGVSGRVAQRRAATRQALISP